MKILTTLAENKYFLGAAALLNSIVRNGTYVDKVVIGYRDELPQWLPPTRDGRYGEMFLLPSGLPVELVEMTGDFHMVHEKPAWFRYLMDELEPEATEFLFFDSDIIVDNRMSFFGEWVRQGVALCGDVNYEFHRSSPIRKQWTKELNKHNRTVRNTYDYYYNSGFIGWRREHAQFIYDWNDAFSFLAPHSGGMKEFRVKDRTNMVLSANQDSLNMAMMMTDVPVSALGPEAMGFEYGLKLMHHPLGPKPWSRNFLKDFFCGRPPRRADIMFWENINGSEFKPLSRIVVFWKLNICNIYRFLGRFYRKY